MADFQASVEAHWITVFAYSSGSFFDDRLTLAGSCDKAILGTDDAIPASAEWNPATNPDGVKCSALKQMANQVGVDPATGFVNSTPQTKRMSMSAERKAAGQSLRRALVQHRPCYGTTITLTPTAS